MSHFPPRMAAAALLAPLAVLALPVSAALFAVLFDNSFLADGRPDNAPMRAGMLFLVVFVPVLYLVLAGAIYGLSQLLLWARMLTSAKFMGIAVAVGILLGLSMGYVILNGETKPVPGVFWMIVVLTLASSACFAVGAWSWWRIAFSTSRPFAALWTRFSKDWTGPSDRAEQW